MKDFFCNNHIFIMFSLRGNPDFFHKFYRIILFEYRAIVANRREKVERRVERDGEAVEGLRVKTNRLWAMLEVQRGKFQ
jgi:hypothetical protein